MNTPTIPAPPETPVASPLDAPRLPRIVVREGEHMPPLADARLAFLRREAATSRRFVDRFAAADFDGPGASYSREYRCDCGFRCSGAAEIFDHAEACK